MVKVRKFLRLGTHSTHVLRPFRVISLYLFNSNRRIVEVLDLGASSLYMPWDSSYYIKLAQSTTNVTYVNMEQVQVRT